MILLLWLNAGDLIERADAFAEIISEAWPSLSMIYTTMRI
jgi:hypothetical protein